MQAGRLFLYAERNLKSELMRMVFATQAGNDAFLYSSSIEVLDEKDAQVLADYICT